MNRLIRSRLSRRAAIRGGAIGVAGLAGAALVGCGDEDEAPGTSTSTPGTTSTTTPGATGTAESTPGGGSAGGTLRWGLKEDLVALEPHTFTGDVPGATVNQIWDTLTEYNSNYEPQGRLAETFEINEEGSEFILHLRQGVKWHSGRDFTAEDVVYNMDRVIDPELPFAQLRAMRDLYSSIEATDDYTVVMTAKSPTPVTFDFLEFLSIGDRESLDEGVAADLTTAGGTGPYMLEERRPGESLVLVKNPNYWEEGVPVLDRQEFAVSLDPQAMATQFESGALDAILQPTVRDFVRLRDAGFQAITHPRPANVFGIGMNSVGSGGTPIEFTDKRVRQALNWAIDRQRFTELQLLGTVNPISLPWPEDSIAYNEDQSNHYQFNLETAKQLLDAAGVTNLGFRVLAYTGVPEQIEFAQIYQEDLASIGVTFELDVVENAAFVQFINSDPPDYAGMYFAGTGRQNLTPITMVNLGSVTWSPVLAGEFEGRPYGDNNTGYYSEEYADVVAQLNVEIDPERQRELYRRFNEIVLEDSWFATLAMRPTNIVVANNVSGVEPDAGRNLYKMRYASIG